PSVTMQYGTATPASVQRAVVAAQPKSQSSGWATTTRARSTPSMPDTGRDGTGHVIGRALVPYSRPDARPSRHRAARAGPRASPAVLEPSHAPARPGARPGPVRPGLGHVAGHARAAPHPGRRPRIADAGREPAGRAGRARPQRLRPGSVRQVGA